ncbi:DUF4179 domain-containing protein [Paenibacillus sp. Z6-24]
MKSIEDTLKQRIPQEDRLAYPDFDRMWARIETAERADSQPLPTPDRHAPPFRQKRTAWKKSVFIASLSLLIAAVPVYAAIQIDWSRVLHYRGGVESALAQHLGQPVEQSVTEDGVTVTIHTAVVDENRTVFLYSLDPGEHRAKSFGFLQMELTDASGQMIPGLTLHQQWDNDTQRFTGYLETSWTPPSPTSSVHLSLRNLQWLMPGEQPIPVNAQNAYPQQFALQQDGMDQLEVQMIRQGPEQMLVSSAISFTNEEARTWSYPQLSIYTAKGTVIQPIHSGTYGTPDEQGRYTGQDYYLPDDLQQPGLSYRLEYTREAQRLADRWNFDIPLDKRQMESGTIRQPLNLPLESGNSDILLKSMVISPTQIRILLSESPAGNVPPFARYDLHVGDKTLTGYADISSDTHGETVRQSVLIFERPLGMEIDRHTSITLTAQHRIISHHGTDQPVTLSNITEQRQSLRTMIGGFPVVWTYYRQNGHLYVQTESSDSHFGGISQTSIRRSGKQLIGQPLTIHPIGDGNNKAIEVYPDFTDSHAAVDVLFYTEENPDQTADVTLPLSSLPAKP